jgi:hypothetical protein
MKSAVALSGQALSLTAAILRAGGVAAKGESAGIAHGRNCWLELASNLAHAREKGDAHCRRRELVLVLGATADYG